MIVVMAAHHDFAVALLRREDRGSPDAELALWADGSRLAVAPACQDWRRDQPTQFGRSALAKREVFPRLHGKRHSTSCRRASAHAAAAMMTRCGTRPAGHRGC